MVKDDKMTNKYCQIFTMMHPSPNSRKWKILPAPQDSALMLTMCALQMFVLLHANSHSAAHLCRYQHKYNTRSHTKCFQYFFVLVLVFVNGFVIFSFLVIFVFVNENHTDD